MKILYSEEGTAYISFPAGLPKDKGTCEFATEICLKKCPQERNKILFEVLQFFENHNPEFIVETIKEQMVELGCTVLYWFWSGDCPIRLTMKINQIQKCLSDAEIVQMGFTRNIKLWELSQQISNMRFILTVESEKEIESFAKKGEMIGVPDYKKEIVKIYLDGTCYAFCGDGWLRCGSYWIETTSDVFQAFCSECYEHLRGCFTNFQIDSTSRKEKNELVVSI